MVDSGGKHMLNGIGMLASNYVLKCYASNVILLKMPKRSLNRMQISFICLPVHSNGLELFMLICSCDLDNCVKRSVHEPAILYLLLVSSISAINLCYLLQFYW